MKRIARAFPYIISLFIIAACPAKDISIIDSGHRPLSSFKHISQDSSRKKTPSDVITLEQVKDSLQLYQQHNDTLRIARSYHKLGDLHRKLNDPSNAVAHYLMAVNHYRQLDRTEQVIVMYQRVAGIYRRHDQFDMALQYANRSHDLATNIKSDSLIAMSAYQLGRIYEEVGRHRQAVDAYQTALDLFQKYDHSRRLADIYHHLAEVHEDLGHLDRTLDLHRRALDIRNNIKDSLGLAKSYYEMGQLFAAKDDVKMAVNYHQHAANIRNRLGHPLEEAENYIKIGEIHSDNGHPERALNYAKRALKIANSFDALELKVEAVKLALDTHIRLGNINRAADLRDSLKELQDSLEVLKHEQEQRNLTFHLRTKEKVDSLEQLQKAQETQKAQLEKEHFLLIIAVIVALALIIILVLLYNRYRYRRHQENLLRSKNEELENLNERLEALNEEKNDIMQTVTHDMKNPLAGIIGLAALILSDADSMTHEEMMDFVQQIRQSAENMNDMVRKLLDVRKIESNGHDLDVEPNNITKILEDTIESNSQRAKEKNIKIVSNFNRDPEMVTGDHTAIQRVLDNLISNAIKYSPKGKKVTLNLLQKNGDVRIEVEDEGPGIRREERSRLFNKFSRLSTEPTDGENSTGLGLYIAKKLTDEMNGDIGCESEPGKGSTFYLMLPRSVRN
ncbi:MAG TPA: tetratricopeptide repeat-containing sensor histidine kinase [Balneolaceae bacterium]|nr:tetratricopeptide repeat-containing sensor histidine kinase [Balneolaceae bacterium]